MRYYNRNERGFVLKSRLVGFIFLIIITMLFLSVASGANYPTKTIQIICPYDPGGISDLVARVLKDKLSTILGQMVVVVNKTGGGGVVGTNEGKIAEPDGHTILTSPPGIIMIPLVTKGITFSLKDFTPINLAVSMPTIIVVKKDAPWQTLEEMIVEAKKNPGKLTYSVPGPGTAPHFAGELFKKTTDTDITTIPMGSAAKAITTLLGGHVDMAFPSFGGAIPDYLKAGSCRALMVMYHKRLKELPDVPTTVEKGYPQLTITSWHAYLVPAKTPKVIVRRLGEAFNEALRDKEVVGKLEKMSLCIENLGPEETARFLAEEQRRWSEVAKAAKLIGIE